MLTKEEKKYYQETIKGYELLSKVAWGFLILPVSILLYFCLIEKPMDNIGTVIFLTIISVLAYTRAVSFDFKADILNDIVNKPGVGEKVEVVGIKKLPAMMFEDLVDWVKYHWLLSSVFCLLVVVLMFEWLR